MTTIRLITKTEQFQSLALEWDQLVSPSPMQSHAWLFAWWKAFSPSPSSSSPNMSLHIMEMRDEYGRLFAIVPWYRKATLAGGTTLSFLGGMRTCSDFQSIICREGWQNVASDTLIQWLEGRYMDGWTGGNQSHWDLLDLEGVSSGDPVMNRFIETLNARGHIVHRASQQNTWRMDLGASWKDFLASQSKSQSSQLRNFINRFEKSSDYTFLRARDHQDQVDYYIATLIDLHQSRWKAEEHSGCFGQQSMRDFFTNAMRSLISTGTADIALLLLDRHRWPQMFGCNKRVSLSDINAVETQRLTTCESEESSRLSASAA